MKWKYLLPEGTLAVLAYLIYAYQLEGKFSIGAYLLWGCLLIAGLLYLALTHYRLHVSIFEDYRWESAYRAILLGLIFYGTHEVLASLGRGSTYQFRPVVLGMTAFLSLIVYVSRVLLKNPKYVYLSDPVYVSAGNLHIIYAYLQLC